MHYWHLLDPDLTYLRILSEEVLCALDESWSDCVLCEANRPAWKDMVKNPDFLVVVGASQSVQEEIFATFQPRYGLGMIGCLGTEAIKLPAVQLAILQQTKGVYEFQSPIGFLSVDSFSLDSIVGTKVSGFAVNIQEDFDFSDYQPTDLEALFMSFQSIELKEIWFDSLEDLKVLQRVRGSLHFDSCGTSIDDEIPPEMMFQCRSLFFSNMMDHMMQLLDILPRAPLCTELVLNSCQISTARIAQIKAASSVDWLSINDCRHSDSMVSLNESKVSFTETESALIKAWMSDVNPDWQSGPSVHFGPSN